MSEEEVELEEFFDAPTTWADIGASNDGSLIDEANQTPEDGSSSQVAELSASASHNSSISSTSNSNRRSLSDVTQLLLTSTAFVACLGTLVALGIQIWSVKVQQSQKMARSVFLSKRDDGSSVFSSNGSVGTFAYSWELLDARQELQIYELWAWRITALFSLLLNYRQCSLPMFCMAGVISLRGCWETVKSLATTLTNSKAPAQILAQYDSQKAVNELLTKSMNVIDSMSCLATLGSRCQSQCRCRCHKDKIAGTRQEIISGIVGRLVLLYKFSSCNVICCAMSADTRHFSSAQVNYSFPRWFLQKALYLEMSWNRYRPLLITIARIIPGDHPAWGAIRSGDLQSLQRLIMSESWLPINVDASGMSLLLVCLESMLLNQN